MKPVLEIRRQIKTFTIKWRSGQTESISGTSFSDAFTSAGYGEVDLDLLVKYEETTYVNNCLL